MKYVKMLGLLAVAAAAMMAFAASASADYVTTTTGGATPALNTEKIHAVSGGHIILKNPIASISCNSTVEGTVETHTGGTESTAAEGKITVLDWTNCTNSWHVTNDATGSLSIHWTSGHDGTLYSEGARVRTTRLGVTCVYETKHTHIGTLTGGSSATLHVKASISINTKLSSGLCGTANSNWEGAYDATHALYVVDAH